jgi:hypothetical protein
MSITLTRSQRRTILGLVLAGSAAGFAQVPHQETRAVGVLVGVWDPGQQGEGSVGEDRPPPSTGRLRTIWLAGTSATAKTPRVLPYLLVPRKVGFWRLGLYGECEVERETDIAPPKTKVTIREHIWAVPVDAVPTVRIHDPYDTFHPAPCRTRSASCVNNETVTVFWVWPEYVSLDVGAEVSCGVHPDWYPQRSVRRLDELQRDLTVGEVLGPAAEAAFAASFTKARADPEACHQDAQFQPESWWVERVPGGWNVRGWTDTHRLCGYGTDFDIPSDIATLTGHKPGVDRVVAGRTKVGGEELYPDAHPSPTGQWTLHVNRDEVSLTADGNTVPLAKAAKRAGEHVVMVEWSSGDHVARWDEEVRRLLRKAPPRPRVGRTRTRQR